MKGPPFIVSEVHVENKYNKNANDIDIESFNTNNV